MIEINTGDKSNYYYLDLNKINDWIFNNTSDIKNIEKRTNKFTKEDGTEGEETVIIENNTPKEIYSSRRFELISDMFDALVVSNADSDSDGVKYIQDIDELGITSKIILNTFMENGFLVDKLETSKKKK